MSPAIPFKTSLASPAVGDRPLRVLLVDDDPAYSALVDAVLAHLDDAPVLRCVLSATEAEELLADETFDCVLVDLSLEDAPGLEVVDRLIVHTDAPLLVLTGSRDPELALGARRRGAHDFVPKGQELDGRLWGAIRRAVEEDTRLHAAIANAAAASVGAQPASAAPRNPAAAAAEPAGASADAADPAPRRRPADDGPRPLEGASAVRRGAPFVFAATLGATLVPLAAGASFTDLWHHWLILATLLGLGRLVPFDRLPAWVQAAPPMLWLAFVVVLRETSGEAPGLVAPLVLLTPFWFALHGTRRQLWIAVAGVAFVLAGPVVWSGAPLHTLMQATLIVCFSAALGLTIQRLVASVRASAEEIRRSAGRSRSSFEQSLVGMAITSKEGRFVEVNDALCRIMRRPREELVGIHLSLIVPRRRRRVARAHDGGPRGRARRLHDGEAVHRRRRRDRLGHALDLDRPRRGRVARVLHRPRPRHHRPPRGRGAPGRVRAQVAHDALVARRGGGAGGHRLRDRRRQRGRGADAAARRPRDGRRARPRDGEVRVPRGARCSPARPRTAC